MHCIIVSCAFLVVSFCFVYQQKDKTVEFRSKMASWIDLIGQRCNIIANCWVDESRISSPCFVECMTPPQFENGRAVGYADCVDKLEQKECLEQCKNKIDALVSQQQN